VRGEELLTMESPRIKLLVPQTAERARIRHRPKELRAAADKDKRNHGRERKEREKLQRKAEKLAEKAFRKKVKTSKKVLLDFDWQLTKKEDNSGELKRTGRNRNIIIAFQVQPNTELFFNYNSNSVTKFDVVAAATILLKIS
jgi:hypothetical protein